MKKVLKVLGIIFGGIIVIGIIESLVSNGNDKTTSEPAKTEQTQPAQSTTPATTTPKNDTPQQAAPTPAPEPKKGITKAEFDQIQNGMTYEQVVQIIGSEGEVMSESGQKGDQYYTVMYTWEGESGFGANANAMFQGGKMVNKAQFGLK